jgi:hypothetical protein
MDVDGGMGPTMSQGVASMRRGAGDDDLMDEEGEAQVVCSSLVLIVDLCLQLFPLARKRCV